MPGAAASAGRLTGAAGRGFTGAQMAGFHMTALPHPTANPRPT